MKKLALIFGFLFCVTFAANAQLKYQNGKLLFNVPDEYQLPNGIVGSNLNVIWGGGKHGGSTHIFLTYTGSGYGEFYIQPASAASCYIGPLRQEGYIYMMSKMGNYHKLYLGNVYNQSDARSKTNIRPLSSATSTIMRLNPVTYQFINRSNEQSTKRVAGADDTETGFLAQDVARVLPNSVAIDDNDQYLVNYISIIPVLVKAMQEQNAQIEALKAEIATLKNR